MLQDLEAGKRLELAPIVDAVVELAERLQAQHCSVVAPAPRCEKLGLATRHLRRVDRRRVEVSFAPKGSRRPPVCRGGSKAGL